MSVMDVNVRKIYSDSYRAYQEWQKLHDMRLFNQRIQAIARENRKSFCTSILLTLASQVQGEKDEQEKFKVQ